MVHGDYRVYYAGRTTNAVSGEESWGIYYHTFDRDGNQVRRPMEDGYTCHPRGIDHDREAVMNLAARWTRDSIVASLPQHLQDLINAGALTLDERD